MVERRIAVIVVVSVLSALLVSLLLLGAFLYPGNVASSSSSSQLSGYSRPSTTEYDYSSSVSPVYAQLGYPALTYNGVSQYDPHMPNFTVEYRGTHFGFDIGSVQAAPVMNLTTAVGLAAASTPDLDSSNYTLAAAEFDPGVLVNNTVWAPATWSLWFAQTYDGFWLYGSGSNEATSAYVGMDALSGAVLDSHDFPTYQPILSGNYKLDITATQAIQTVRGLGEFQNFSTALTESGNITSISPRIIKFDPGALPLQQPIDPALDGQSRLCWVISLTHETGFGGAAGSLRGGRRDRGPCVRLGAAAISEQSGRHGEFLDGHPVRPEHHDLPGDLPDERERRRLARFGPCSSARRIRSQARLDSVDPGRLLLVHR